MVIVCQSGVQLTVSVRIHRNEVDQPVVVGIQPQSVDLPISIDIQRNWVHVFTEVAEIICHLLFLVR